MFKQTLGALCALGLGGAASAATLDFTTVEPGVYSETIRLNGSDISNAFVIDGFTLINGDGGTGGVQVGAGAAGDANGFCFTGIAEQSGCQADGRIIFPEPVNELSFFLNPGAPGSTAAMGQTSGDQVNFDQVTVRYISAQDNSIIEQTFTTQEVPTNDVTAQVLGGGLAWEVSLMTPIVALAFDDTSQDGGFGFSNFAFGPGSGGTGDPIPVPAAALLMPAGLVLLRRRRRG